MCGIFGYFGSSSDSPEIIKNGLKRLEYRGYDSWGIAVLNSDKKKIELHKQIGAIGEALSNSLSTKSTLGIGHTRWATHGGVTKENAHPHFSTDKSFILAQNGIVENYQELKKSLLSKDYNFETQTDTEVIVRLIEDKLKNEKTFEEAIRSAFLKLKGRNTIIILSAKDNEIIAVRNGSPLVVGVKDSDYFIASDTLSFADKTNKVILINDMEMVKINNGGLKVIDIVKNKERKYKVEEIEKLDNSIDKEGFDYFMLKEIFEQKDTIRQAVQYEKEELKPFISEIKNAKTVYTIGAGSANYAAGQCAFFLRNIAKIRAVELKSYDLNGYENLFSKNDLVIAFSQSGETADTIEAINIAKKCGVKVASLVNMTGSTITRISDFPFALRSGPEVSVVSTKALTAMCAWGFLIANAVIDKEEFAKKEIDKLSKNLKKFFENKDNLDILKKIALKLEKSEHIFVLGKGQNLYTALEGSLKLKETAYKHAEGFSAGELKHGVIALIEKKTPVFVICSNDEDKKDILSAAAQVKARGAYVIGIAKENNDLLDSYVPSVDCGLLDLIANIIPFHLVAYYLAVKLGYSPDKPRNLAKSVTVK